MRGRRRRTDLDGSHEAAIGVIEDVAVEHPLAGAFVEGDQKARGRFHRDVQGVLPRHRPQRCAVFIDGHEEVPVQMERVVPLRVVADHPELRFTERRSKRLRFPERLPCKHLSALSY